MTNRVTRENRPPKSSKLTDGNHGTIAKAEAPATGQRFVFDDHRDSPRGFALRITSTGGKAFVLNYTFEGTARRKTIGAWPLWSLVAARDEANKVRRRIDTGVDVLDVARRERAEMTVAAAVALYCPEHVDGLKSGPTIRRYFERDVVPIIGSRKLKDVGRAEIIELVRGRAKAAPRAAVLLLTHLKGLFYWALDREIIRADPAAGIKPRKVNPEMRAGTRGRVLSDAELRAFWSSAESCGIHRLTALALKFVLVTGQRPGEVAGIRWCEIDGDVWTIPAERRGKTKTAHAVPLTSTALEILESARAEVERLTPRRKAGPAVFVFETRPGAPPAVNALDRAVRRHTTGLGNVDVETWGHWTPHDLRRTCRTGLAAGKVAEFIAEQVVGHTKKGIIAVYDQHTYNREKRAAQETWERRLLRIAEGLPADDNVVPLVRREAES